MNEPWREDERIAALLDGRLGERDRAEVMTHLANEDDAYEVFVCTAVVLREAEGEEPRISAAVSREVGRHGSALHAQAFGWPHTRPSGAGLDDLTAEFDALLARMQSPDVRRAMRRAFNASPEELRQAAMEAARTGDG